MLEAAIAQAWTAIRERVESKKDLEFDHEFTLQFHLAWELARIFHFINELNVRFEVPCGKDADGETIRLDLLVWLDPKAKVAIELKAPIRSESGMNSAMTQMRMRFYRDLNRLRHLTESGYQGIRSGIFLAVVNERGYVLERRQTVNAVYRTYHGTVTPAGARIPATAGSNGYPFELIMPSQPIRWTWSCDTAGGQMNPCNGMRHYWLEPICIGQKQVITPPPQSIAPGIR